MSVEVLPCPFLIRLEVYGEGVVGSTPEGVQVELKLNRKETFGESSVTETM